jgi:hypothetical protein
VNARQWTTSIGLIAALMVSAVAVVQSQPDAESPRGTEPLAPSWSRPVRDVVSLTVSPGGARVLAADVEGKVNCYDTGGTLLWSQEVPGADSLAASRDGLLTLAYAARQPLSRRVVFIDERGKPFHVAEPEEPVQAAIVSPDGRTAAIAAGRKVLLCSRQLSGVHTSTIRLAGEVSQLQFGPGDSVYVACRDPYYVALVKSTGRVLWRRKDAATDDFSISASEDGKLLSVARQRPEDGKVEVTLLNSRNQRQWVTTRPGRAPLVRLCTGGAATMLTYEHKVEHNRESRFERRLAYLAGPAGEWTKGGPFTAPLYVSADREGDWVVALDMQGRERTPRFRLYGRNGERRWIYECPAGVLIASASSEGRHIAAYRSDGVVEVMKVSAP